ncbi:MAG: hypothetical protein IJZ93_01080 [Clostridia bacterium]|nr:hypothetical protein [Clostridia bacterium]
MIKVAYRLTKVNDFNYVKKGIGFISNSKEDLILYPNTQFEKVIEDCIRYCYPIPYRSGEFKGSFTQYVDCDFQVKDSIETKEIEIEYRFWYKILD